MRVLVDTSAWSLALRRKQPDPHNQPVVELLSSLLLDAQVVMIGAIRQELLSGIQSNEQFELLRDRLSVLPDRPIQTADYLSAAQLSNTCRAHGVQGSPTDFLICAVAVADDLPILTTDKDFTHFARHIPITLLPLK